MAVMDCSILGGDNATFLPYTFPVNLRNQCAIIEEGDTKSFSLEKTIFYIIHFPLCIMTIALNITAIILVSNMRGAVKATNKLFMNLAGANIVTSIFSLTREIIYGFVMKKHSEFIWIITFWVLDVPWATSYFVAVLSLVGIALVRYIAVRHPLKGSSLLTRSRVHNYILMTWIISMFSIPLISALLRIFPKHSIFGKYCRAFALPLLHIICYLTSIGLVLRVLAAMRRAKKCTKKLARMAKIRDTYRGSITTLMLTLMSFLLLMPSVLYFVLVQLKITKYTLFLECAPVMTMLLDPIVYSLRTQEIWKQYELKLRDVKCYFCLKCSDEETTPKHMRLVTLRRRLTSSSISMDMVTHNLE
ncbi:unnamed protein product [Owenia fusiformis]|uniref:Uncharacterized protein n=1 Tax=Owenia fusiformis TaxID=6347 RepID=A0A8J1XYS8_OWEFU|nr:unnamed protein product [Owenia fusiformis]